MRNVILLRYHKHVPWHLYICTCTSQWPRTLHLYIHTQSEFSRKKINTIISKYIQHEFCHYLVDIICWYAQYLPQTNIVSRWLHKTIWLLIPLWLEAPHWGHYLEVPVLFCNFSLCLFQFWYLLLIMSPSVIVKLCQDCWCIVWKLFSSGKCHGLYGLVINTDPELQSCNTQYPICTL